MILPGFSVEVLRLLKDQSDFALGIPLFLNSFIKERFPISGMLTLALMIVVFSLLIPLVVFGGYVFLEQVNIVLSENFFLLERASCAFGAISLLFSFLYVVIFHTPLPTRKNIKSIRWGVLHYLAPLDGHPRVKEWLDDKS